MEAQPEGGFEIKLRINDEVFKSPVIRGHQIEWEKDMSASSVLYIARTFI